MSKPAILLPPIISMVLAIGNLFSPQLPIEIVFMPIWVPLSIGALRLLHQVNKWLSAQELEEARRAV